MTHTVAVLALDMVAPLNLGIPTQVFAARYGLGYRVRVYGETPRVHSEAFDIVVDGDVRQAHRADTLVIPTSRPQVQPSDEVLDLIRHVLGKGRRVVSFCTGAYALAEAGVLDGLSATTHWKHAADFGRRYPLVNVKPDVLYVDEGQVLTAAGSSAGMDLCLHVVRRDHGAGAANELARHVVAAPHRDGGQAQFIEAPVPEDGDASCGLTREWALERLGEALSVGDLARHAGLSERTLARRFTAETGLTPLQWLLRARVDRARHLLEAGPASVEQVAARVGLGTPANLRVHFRRQLGTSPTAYRRTFQEAGA